MTSGQWAVKNGDLREKDQFGMQKLECGMMNDEYTKETACGFAPPTVHCPLPTTHYLPPTIYYLLFLFLFAAISVNADESDQEKDAAKWITPAAEKAIGHGLRWLAERQHDDGSFGNGPARGNVAVCGLAGMAFMSGGSTPGRGPYGDQVNK